MKTTRAPYTVQVRVVQTKCKMTKLEIGSVKRRNCLVFVSMKNLLMKVCIEIDVNKWAD